jgi:hypothetical protein
MIKRIALLCIGVFFGQLPFSMAAYTTVVNNGPSSNRVDIVFLGDGYTASDIAAGTYNTHVQNYVNYMFTNSLNSEPFYRYRNFFNIHTIEVVSAQSGADVPPQNIYRNTALDATYYGDGTTERLLAINQNKANSARNSALTGAGFTAEMQFVTVNDTKYGGSGGNYAVFAGGNFSSSEIGLHEIAHSFSDLADEYGGYTTTYTGPEPGEINVTKDSTGSKWSRWLGYNQAGIGVIGAYQGGRYYNSGIYRPSNNSKMRTLGNPFDAIAREKIVLDIYDLVSPFDSWTNNSIPLTDPGDLSVVLIDDTVLDVEWFVDDVLVPSATSTSFDLGDFAFGPGTYTVTARGYDPMGFDPVNGWVRMDQENLEQFVSWNVTLSSPIVTGDFDNDGDVDGRDFLAWQRGESPNGVGSISDLTAWQANYGSPALSAATARMVPEPMASCSLSSILSTIFVFNSRCSSCRRLFQCL